MTPSAGDKCRPFPCPAKALLRTSIRPTKSPSRRMAAPDIWESPLRHQAIHPTPARMEWYAAITSPAQALNSFPSLQTSVWENPLADFQVCPHSDTSSSPILLAPVSETERSPPAHKAAAVFPLSMHNKNKRLPVLPSVPAAADIFPLRLES